MAKEASARHWAGLLVVVHLDTFASVARAVSDARIPGEPRLRSRPSRWSADYCSWRYQGTANEVLVLAAQHRV
jgi:hypothetical protein